MAKSGQFLDLDIAEFIGQAFLAVVLQGNVSFGIFFVVEVNRLHTIDEYFQVVAVGFNAVFVPRAVFECSLSFWFVLEVNQPCASAFVV